ncbi:MAG: outer membrane protein transport protein [Pontiellaceae bacterium]|nr:outer membrane protein transport protein [Pontiellaceae bacterium]MBN2785488.1 outer membrane protein transport protein [Pontiellaceae bacterium]
MNKRLMITAVAAAAAATQVFATEGINLIGVGPVQQGTAGAGVASAKDSTWLILNPAGLVDLQPSMDASFQVFAPVRTINSTLSFAGEQEDDSMFVIPSISTSFGCCQGENGFVGLGIYGTSGMGVDYDFGRVGGDSNSDGMPDMAQNMVDQMTELSVAKMTATYAYRFGDSGLSIGAGPIIVLARFRTDMLDPTFTPASGKWDTAYGFGGIFGVNQHLGRLSLGASYMTEQNLTEFDEYDSLFIDSLNLPQQFTIGAAYNVLDNVEVALDYRWIGWGELDTMGDQFGWENQNVVKAGVTWSATDALVLRTGISYGKSPIDESTAFSNALFPAIMETHFACGASYAWEQWAAHFAYIHAFEENLTANGNDMPFGMGAGTEISMYQNSLTAGVTYTF